MNYKDTQNFYNQIANDFFTAAINKANEHYGVVSRSCCAMCKGRN